MTLVCSLLISVTIGYLILTIFFIGNGKSDIGLYILKMCLAIGLGFGVTSLVYFLWLIFFGTSSSGFIIIELAMLAVLLITYVRNKEKNVFEIKRNESDAFKSKNLISRILLILCTGLIASLVVCFYLDSSVLTDGGWDAWLIWNLLAKFLYRGGYSWHIAMNNLPMNHHADYPLLLPSSVARIWQYSGGENHYAPALIGFLFTIAVTGLIISTVSIIKNRSQACLAGIIMAGTTNYILLGAYQYADVPLSYFFLATLALLFLQGLTEKCYRLSVLAGVMSGLGCWTKNEGFLFLCVIGMVYLILISVKKHKKVLCRQLSAFTAGALIILPMVIFFKIAYAPTNDMYLYLNINHMLSNLLDLGRYMDIAKHFIDTIIDTNQLILFTLLYPIYFGMQKDIIHRDSTKLIMAIIIVMMAGYFLIYVVTPYDLKWHLASSVSRLLMQLWPSIIFLTFIIAEVPENCFISIPDERSDSIHQLS